MLYSRRAVVVVVVSVFRSVVALLLFWSHPSTTLIAAPAENPLRKALQEGRPVIGMTITVPSPDIVLQAARLGFDFVWIEMEHSPITLESARAMILATHGTGMIPLIRVPVNELWTAKRALDCGALGIVFPFTSTPELARQAVAACHYPPEGLRGAGAGLATLRWPAPDGYADFADAQGTRSFPGVSSADFHRSMAR